MCKARLGVVLGGQTVPKRTSWVWLHKGRQVAISDQAVAALALAISFVLAATTGQGQHAAAADWLEYLVTATCCAALAARGRHPVPVAALAGFGLAVFAVRGYAGGPLVAPVLTSLYTLGTAIERRHVLLAGVAATVLLTARSWATASMSGQTSAYTWAIPGWALTALLWGTVVRSRRETIEAIRQRAELAERSREEEAARRVAAERLRIARDLHDVVGHSLASLNVQARVAKTLFERAPERARQALDELDAISRSALREIRESLNLLRDPAAAEPDLAAGTPGIDQLDGLTAPLRVAGITVELTVTLPRPLPAVVGATMYRIAQEALTNVLRHAAPSRVGVHVFVADGSAQLTIANDVGGTPSAAAAPALALGQETGTGGTGIRGMGERANALGGQLTAGPAPGGGFVVAARFPMAG